MEIYAQPLSRVLFGQNKLLSINASQRAMYFKYATIIKTFISGTTTEVLRMRLQQVVEASLMTLKSFLNYHKVNIILALRHCRSFLILVFPPCDISPDLSNWNAKLLCLVLRASNSLNVREQDDVIYLSKIYKRYINNKLEDPGYGTITRKGYVAKKEWFKTCSAVLRIVEVADDPGLIKEVRAFICKVEMERKSPTARKESQLKLESFVSELLAGDKQQGSNLTDKTKQIANKEFTKPINHKRKKTYLQRPLSADARINLDREAAQKTDFYNTSRKSIQNWSRPTSATKSVKSQSSRRSSFKFTQRSSKKPLMKVKINNDKVNEKKMNKVQKEKSRSIRFLEKERNTNRKITCSALERNAPKTPTKAGILRRSNIRLNHSGLNDSGSNEISSIGLKKNFTPNMSKDNSIISKPGSAMENRSIRYVPKTRMPLKKSKSKGETEMVSSHKYSYVLNDKRDSTIKRENSMILKGIRPNSGRRQNSERSKKTSKESVTRDVKQDIRDTVIRVPTAEPELIVANDKNIENEDKQRTGTCNKEEESKNNSKRSREGKTSEKTVPSLEKLSTKGNQISDVNDTEEKRKVFDENMNKIANEVLVHQKIHEAAKNPLLQNKEFVDEFFAFLNTNHVTKKFLRAQSSEPRESWSLPSGKHAHFSFFLAFVFRHVHTKDVKMVSYVVEKMLLRMRCKHGLNQRTCYSNSHTIHDMTENVECLLSPEHEDRRRVYQEVTSMFDCELRVNTSKLSSASNERRPLSSKSSKRRHTSPKMFTRPGCHDDNVMNHRSTVSTDNLCWKCMQKDLALTVCVNWSNRYLCDLLISEGVLYKEEHLSAAVKANDLISLVKIVDFLKNRGVWNDSSSEVRDALFLARKLKMQKMVEFLVEENVQDERVVNNNICTPCFIA